MAALNFVQQTFQSERPLEVSTAEDKEAFRMLRRAKSMHDMDPTGHCSEARVLPTGSPDLKPRKMHNLRLCDIQWEALANRREQRRVLNLRGLPTKLCTTEALHAWLRAGGLGDTVEDLKVFPGKAGRLGCAVVRAREAADVESLAKLFHGCQFGAGSPIAVSFAAPRSRGSAQFGATPAKVQSSFGTAKQPASSGLIPGTITLVQSTDLGAFPGDSPKKVGLLQLC